MFDFIWVVKNEQHKLLDAQKVLLMDFAWRMTADLGTIDVPVDGWTLEQIEKAVDDLPPRSGLVFLSPVPAFMVLAAREGIEIFAFHNNRREKKVLPDGRVVMTVPDDGWMII